MTGTDLTRSPMRSMPRATPDCGWASGIVARAGADQPPVRPAAQTRSEPHSRSGQQRGHSDD
jgi:hypothetical protein